MKWSNDVVYNWMLELAETALDIDENNVEDVEDFFRVRKMKGIAIDILKCEKVMNMNETRVVNKYKESYDVYIGRGSKWGNPFTHISDKKTKADFIVNTREQAIESYRDWILNQPQLLKDLHELKGKTLGCFCKPKKCHGDVLVELVNKLGE